MKIKLNTKKETLKEVEPVTILLFVSLLLNALQFFFPRLRSFIADAGKKLDSGIKDTETAVGEMQISEEEKQAILTKISTAKKDLQNTLRVIEQNPQKISRKQRPSAIIAQKIKALLDVIQDIRKQYAKQLDQNKNIKVRIDKSIKSISQAVGTVARLDLISALSSKKDPNGLWNKVPALQKSSFRNDRDWLNFSFSVANTATNPESFKTAEMPKVTEEGKTIFKLSGDRFILSEGYGSVRGVSEEISMTDKEGNVLYYNQETGEYEPRKQLPGSTTQQKSLPPKPTTDITLRPQGTISKSDDGKPDDKRDAQSSAPEGTPADVLMRSGVENPQEVLSAIIKWGADNGVTFDKNKLGTIEQSSNDITQQL